MNYDNKQLEAASPSIFAAENGKVETAVEVLKSESNARKPSMEAELLDAAAKLLQSEVL